MLDYVCVSEAKTDLTICRMTEFSASVAGGRDMLLFCDKVVKDDVQVRFFEDTHDGSGKIAWEGFGEFQPSDVHKQFGIAFRTPRYHNLEVRNSMKFSSYYSLVTQLANKCCLYTF
jgi:c-Rel proto-oncogene protein